MERINPIRTIMPETNAEVIYKYLTGAVALLGAYAAIVHAWYNHRFKSVSEKIDTVDRKVDIALEKAGTHDITIATISANMDNIRENTKETNDSIRRIHEKIDKLIANG